MGSDYIFKAFIVNRFEYDNGNKETSGAWLYFPTDTETVKRTLEEIGLPRDANKNQYFFDDYGFGDDYLSKILSMYEDIDELNYLASRISELDDNEIRVFDTVLETEEECRNVRDAINAAYNTEYYSLIVDIYDWADYGKHIAYESGIDISNLGDLSRYIDFGRFGEDYADDHGGYLLDDAVLETGHTDFTRVYDGDITHIPQRYAVSPSLNKVIAEELNELDDAVNLASDIDTFFREHNAEYTKEYPDIQEQRENLCDCLMDRRTFEMKNMLAAMESEGGELSARIDSFERDYPKTTYSLYQLKDGPELHYHRFESLDRLHKNGMAVEHGNYNLVYSEIFKESETFAKLYERFNINRPEDFKGHSMSVSDIIVLHHNGIDTAYYCDKYEFRMVPEFLTEKENLLDAAESTERNNNQLDSQVDNAEQSNTDTMTVLVVPPMQEPYTKEIGIGLEDLQREVGGNIQVLYPFAEEVGLVCNEEGKNIGLDLNRALYDAEGEIYDIVAGTFVLVGLDAEDFTSLPLEQIDTLSKQFKLPEVFVRVNGDIKAIPTKPSIKKELKQFSEKGQKQDRQQRKPPDVGLE